MNPLLAQFLSEARDLLQGVGEKLLQLEDAPDDAELMTALFRGVHTLKGNSGLFDCREMTAVLHVAEDLMDAVRDRRLSYSKSLADHLLDAMDFVGLLCDEIEATGRTGAQHAATSARLVESLHQLVARADGAAAPDAVAAASTAPPAAEVAEGPPLAEIVAALPEAVRTDAAQRMRDGAVLHWVEYCPIEECYFQGDDPLLQARRTPDVLWGSIHARTPWPPLAELDAYRCVLDFHLLTAAPRAELDEHFRYVTGQVRICALPAESLAPPPPSEDAEALAMLLSAQRGVLSLPGGESWAPGRIMAASAALAGCLMASSDGSAIAGLEAATATAVAEGAPTALLAWLDKVAPQEPRARTAAGQPAQVKAAAAAPDGDEEPKFGRRAEDKAGGPRSVKVDQVKIDRLMNLIGEMVVSKNALPYLAGRAETVYGSRDLSREIKAQYAVINRIAEEMQDAIMQVSMMPVSFVFQRFPRLVRDISRKLGKEVNLVLEGEETEADKTIIESLGDPLVHILRNSLDHGIESPEVRLAAGKPAAGKLTIAARQVSDRVVIEISDDGKGIDPAVIKRKAYEKGLIDEATLERLSDQEAVNLIFASGLTTMDAVSYFSGRGVGMDVVRTAVEKVHGSVIIESEMGKGTRIRLSLPLSMAVTNVMIVESEGQSFGVPMESVVETVRVRRDAIRTIKKSPTALLRGRIVPLKSINLLLGLDAAPRANDDGELAVLVVRLGEEWVGLIVDDFHEAVDIILKPMTGVLAGLSAYSGSALMGDGSVLMVLNAQEMM